MKKILIVEDDEYLSEAYKLELQAQNFSVALAKDGEQALELFKEFQPDLLVVDLVMPKKGGLEFLKDINQLQPLSGIPIIVASNVDNEETKTEAFKLGAREYFVKSDISLDSFAEICKKYLV